MTDKEIFIQLLRDTERGGIEQLLGYLGEVQFFDSPASTRYHGTFPGGLAAHSLLVFENFSMSNTQFKMNVPPDSVVLCSLLHDLCKAGAYIPTDQGKYKRNEQHPKGHSLLSLERISRFIPLSEDEGAIIQFHMGMYGSFEFSKERGEYSLKDLVTAFNQRPYCKIFYFSDELAAFQESRQ